MSLIGAYTLFYKELLRFTKVGLQTILAPVISTLLYLLVFAHVLEEHVRVFAGVPYTAFLIPGLIMMAVIQNAFANSSSSLIQSKVSGNIVFVLVAPLSYLETFCAYVAAAVVRGAAVGLGVFACAVWFAMPPMAHPWAVAAFGLLGAAVTGAMGMLAGIWAEKFDHLAAFQNFLIMPLSFLSGVFYSIQSLPPFWRALSHVNPFFYMIDGFRYGFFGLSDVAPALSLAVVGVTLAGLGVLTLTLLKSGYKLRD